MRNTVTLLLALVLAAGCGGEPAGPGSVKAILINPGVALLTQAGATQQFTATAVDAGGSTVPGIGVKWRSSDASVVAIDASTGLATAVAKGTATILAEAGGAAGSASVTVHLPVCVQPTPVSLAVGQTLVTDVPTSAACAVRLPAGTVGSDRYRVAIVRLSTTQDATAPTAKLTIASGGAATVPSTVPAVELPPLLDAAELGRLRSAARLAETTSAAHARLRADEEGLLHGLAGLALLSPGPLRTAPIGPQATAPARRTFVPRASSDGSCSLAGKTPVSAVLVAENAAMAVYQDSAQAQANPAPVESVGRMLDFYAHYGTGTISDYFGAIPDRDGNGQVVVFVTPMLPPEGNVAAFVWGGDQLDTSACAASNEMELVYFNLGLIKQLGPGNYQALETLVHEVKHVVSFNHRLTGVTFNSHPAWLEEGTAEIAGEVASRRAWADAGGPARNARVTRADFPAGSVRITPENYGIFLRLLRTRDYLSAQANSVVFGQTIYGSGWHFSRFLGDGYGGETSTAGAGAFFTAQNAAVTPAGLLGLQSVTGTPFDALLTEYAAAVMLAGTGAPPPVHGFGTYDFPSAVSVVGGGGTYPYPVTGASPAGFDGTWSGPIGNAGLRIHDFVSSSGKAGEITVQVEEPAKLVIVRIR